MVSTVDGSATGEGGRSGTINNEADERVFHILRGLADAIIVGAGTARAEGYGPADARWCWSAAAPTCRTSCAAPSPVRC